MSAMRHAAPRSTGLRARDAMVRTAPDWAYALHPPPHRTWQAAGLPPAATGALGPWILRNEYLLKLPAARRHLRVAGCEQPQPPSPRSGSIRGPAYQPE